MNILLSCAGRRGYMVEYFEDALQGNGSVYVSNSEGATAAVMRARAALIARPIFATGYIDELLGFCQENDIRLLVPLFDLELTVLAENRKQFDEAGVVAAVSDIEVCEICNDKWKTYRFLRDNNFAVTPTFIDVEEACDYLIENPQDIPVFVKPRWGTGSIGVFAAKGVDEVRCLVSHVSRVINSSYLAANSKQPGSDDVLIQRALPGDEYGLDVINDFSGNHVGTIVKRKLGMRAGETDSAITVHSAMLSELGSRIGNALGHIGILDCDVFFDGARPYVLEMNPRFGGGYPFSHLAGARIPNFYLNQVDPVFPYAWSDIDVGVIGIKEITPRVFQGAHASCLFD